ncbi:hypothetical protein INR49_001463 [Caranx melampygus]|nr:hypothetical protein INR49_001463 [Caranx melampygus]
MFKINFSELLHIFILMKWDWTTWMLLYFMVTGTASLVSVHQPPVIATPLGKDATMLCQLEVSPDEEMQSVPVLYWSLLTEDKQNSRLTSNPSETYKGRVDILAKHPNSTNKSILLKNVQWADSGKYECKLSLRTKKKNSFRERGNGTLLVVYDTMTFNLTGHNNSLLRCEVNVSQLPGYVLSIFHNGCNLEADNSISGDAEAAQPFITLSKNISLRGRGEYECRLHLDKDLITSHSLHYSLPGTGEVVFPQPWLLYVALLLVPITILLGLVTILLLCRF